MKLTQIRLDKFQNEHECTMENLRDLRRERKKSNESLLEKTSQAVDKMKTERREKILQRVKLLQTQSNHSGL